MTSQIVLFASEVSVICELNPYRNIHDTFMDVWKRTAPNQILMVEKEINHEMKSKEQSVMKLIKKIDVEGKISDLIKSASTAESIHEVEKSVKAIPNIIPQVESIKDDDIKELITTLGSTNIETEIIKSVESQMNRGFGTNQESVAISRYEDKYKASINQRNDKFHKRVVAEADEYSVIVGGKVDGVKEDGTVVEVKNRMRRFFDPLPKYDIAQLQTYIFILKASQGELVEQLRGATKSIKRTIIKGDSDMWENIIKPKIVKFCEILYGFMKDKDLQRKFILGNEHERKCLINELY